MSQEIRPAVISPPGDDIPSKPENKLPDTDTVRYEMATVWHNSFFLGQFVRLHKAAYERDYLVIWQLEY